MAKQKSVFFCQNCGHEEGKWLGQCPACKEWNTFVEEVQKAKDKPSAAAIRKSAEAVSLNAVSAMEDERVSVGFAEFDRVLGGGMVTGSLVLVGGDPGIGKSTILLQVCRNLSEKGLKVLYISGEESTKQIKLRANRIGDFSDGFLLFCETSLEAIRETIRVQNPDVVVVDSVQTVYCEEISSAPGSVSQVREAAHSLMQIAKQDSVTIFLVGHVTKDGSVAGPRVLEHIVDTVLYFEGDSHGMYRLLRSVKNRFGSTNEIGVFEMLREGLREVKNPSEFLLNGRPVNASGSIVACAMEGTRPMLLEIQALVSKTAFGMPRRTADGIDYNRVNLLLAVMEKRMGIPLSSYDAYINVAGGIKMNEPASDLGVVMAVYSSFRDKALPDDMMVFGEVGLSGEIRAVPMPEQRVIEAKKIGFTTCVLPKGSMRTLKNIEGIKLIGISSLREVAGLI
ncbi:MAG: DNA repair protein RadA [Lachnospiraceae bacterium]|jgi:DNA repair protein RadA/Sms|nr:DNA repair protein RadA [Lachnospiraceae bacterium]